MKKPFSPNRNSGLTSDFGYRRTRSGASFGWYAAAVLFVIVLISIKSFFPNTFIAISSPFWDLGTSLSTNVSSWSAGFTAKQKLAAQNNALSAQVATLAEQNQILTARSQDLTKLLGGESGTTDELLAGVLAGPPESPYDTLIISAGLSDGIVDNALVYSAGGIPIGTIAQVNKNSSQVSLFSTPGRSTSGWVGTNRIPITLMGEGAGAFNAIVSASTTIAVGDTVYMPGPGALPIGTVVRVDNDPSSPTPIIHVQPFVNLFSITWVEVSRSPS